MSDGLLGVLHVPAVPDIVGRVPRLQIPELDDSPPPSPRGIAPLGATISGGLNEREWMLQADLDAQHCRFVETKRDNSDVERRVYVAFEELEAERSCSEKLSTELSAARREVAQAVVHREAARIGKERADALEATAAERDSFLAELDARLRREHETIDELDRQLKQKNLKVIRLQQDIKASQSQRTLQESEVATLRRKAEMDKDRLRRAEEGAAAGRRLTVELQDAKAKIQELETAAGRRRSEHLLSEVESAALRARATASTEEVEFHAAQWHEEHQALETLFSLRSEEIVALKERATDCRNIEEHERSAAERALNSEERMATAKEREAMLAQDLWARCHQVTLDFQEGSECLERERRRGQAVAAELEEALNKQADAIAFAESFQEQESSVSSAIQKDAARRVELEAAVRARDDLVAQLDKRVSKSAEANDELARMIRDRNMLLESVQQDSQVVRATCEHLLSNFHQPHEVIDDAARETLRRIEVRNIDFLIAQIEENRLFHNGFGGASRGSLCQKCNGRVSSLSRWDSNFSNDAWEDDVSNIGNGSSSCDDGDDGEEDLEMIGYLKNCAALDAGLEASKLLSSSSPGGRLRTYAGNSLDTAECEQEVNALLSALCNGGNLGNNIEFGDVDMPAGLRDSDGLEEPSSVAVELVEEARIARVLRSELALSSSRSHTMRLECDTLSSSRAELAQELQRSENELRTALRTRSALSSDMGEQVRRHVEAKQELERQLRDKNFKLKTLGAEKKKLESEREQMEKDVAEQRTYLIRERGQVTEQMRRVQALQQRLRLMEGEKRLSDSKASTLHSQKREIEELRDVWESKAQSSEREAEAQGRKVKKMEFDNKVGAQMHEFFQQHQEAREDQVAKLQQLLTDRDKAVRAAKSEQLRLELQAEENHTLRELAQERFTMSENDAFSMLLRLTAQVEEAKAKEEAESQLRREHEAEAAVLSSRVHAQFVKEEAIENEKKEAHGYGSRQREEASLEARRSERYAANARKSDRERAHLEARVQELETKVSSERVRANAVKSEEQRLAAGLRSQLQLRTQKLQQQDKTLREHRSELANWQERAEERSEKVTSLEKEQVEHKAKSTAQEKKIVTLESECQALEAQARDSSEQFQSLKSRAEAAEAELKPSCAGEDTTRTTQLSTELQQCRREIRRLEAHVVQPNGDIGPEIASIPGSPCSRAEPESSQQEKLWMAEADAESCFLQLRAHRDSVASAEQKMHKVEADLVDNLTELEERQSLLMECHSFQTELEEQKNAVERLYAAEVELQEVQPQMGILERKLREKSKRLKVLTQEQTATKDHIQVLEREVLTQKRAIASQQQRLAIRERAIEKEKADGKATDSTPKSQDGSVTPSVRTRSLSGDQPSPQANRGDPSNDKDVEELRLRCNSLSGRLEAEERLVNKLENRCAVLRHGVKQRQQVDQRCAELEEERKTLQHRNEMQNREIQQLKKTVTSRTSSSRRGDEDNDAASTTATSVRSVPSSSYLGPFSSR